MNLAVSNIALPAYDHLAELAQLRELGFTGLEVAPSRVWEDTWEGLSVQQVDRYRGAVEKAGLEVIGLHSLFFDHPELGLFSPEEYQTPTFEYLTHLSSICRDLGGKTLIYGGGRNRGQLSYEDALEKSIGFMAQLAKKTDGHGTCFCFEPLGPNDSDFINSALESLAIVRSVGHPGFAVQLDAKALVENNEVEIGLFEQVSPHLVHFHANEPGLGVLGSSDQVDHRALGAMLRQIQYEAYVSLEQRMFDEKQPLEYIAQSSKVLESCYLSAADS